MGSKEKEDGYIKFNCEWTITDPIANDAILGLNKCRAILFSKNLIGMYDNGIGFGNISKRIDAEQFIITGSATGRIRELTGQHYTKVTEHNIKTNSLTCEGPIKASSESLTHASIYLADSDVNAVIHVHSLDLWEKLIDKVPTTSTKIAYGTPEMANEIIRLFQETDVINQKIVVMAGHHEGIISFGKDLEEATEIILEK